MYVYPRSRPVWSISPEVAAGYNKLKAWVAMTDALAEQYQAPPSPIEFAPAKSKVRDVELVDMLDSFYKTNQPPPEVHAMADTEVKAAEEKRAFITELDALHKEMLPVLDAEIEFFERVRTTVDTTTYDMRCNYPLIHEEIEDEIERREWFKGTEWESSGAK